MLIECRRSCGGEIVDSFSQEDKHMDHMQREESETETGQSTLRRHRVEGCFTLNICQWSRHGEREREIGRERERDYVPSRTAWEMAEYRVAAGTSLYIE
jgi:hypothetical protein